MYFRKIRAATLALGALCSPSIASAHAFGQQYSLPLPFSYYIFGGVCAFAASAVIISLFSDPRAPSPAGALELRIRYMWIWKLLGVAVFAFFVACAFFGGQEWFNNPAPTLFWIYLLLGFLYLSIFVQGWWPLVDPFRTITALAIERENTFAFPARARYVLPVFLFMLVIWVELFSDGLGSDPLLLGIGAVGYLALSFCAVSFFGSAWFQFGDLFTNLFRIVGEAAPVKIEGETLSLGWPGSRLIEERAQSLVLVFFILVLLASTAIDGIRDTPPWNFFVYHLLPQVGVETSTQVVGSVALFFVPLIFFCFFALSQWVAKELSRTQLSVVALMLRFGFSLIPIAIAYNIAHYFDLLIGESQRLIPLLGDPLARGWNILHLSGYTPNYVPIGANTVWYIQLSVIVIGHTIAALVAHRIAVRTFASKREVILSQIPVLVLMVFYTWLGLWILSQPFVF